MQFFPHKDKQQFIMPLSFSTKTFYLLTEVIHTPKSANSQLMYETYRYKNAIRIIIKKNLITINSLAIQKNNCGDEIKNNPFNNSALLIHTHF